MSKLRSSVYVKVIIFECNSFSDGMRAYNKYLGINYQDATKVTFNYRIFNHANLNDYRLASGER